MGSGNGSRLTASLQLVFWKPGRRMASMTRLKVLLLRASPFLTLLHRFLQRPFWLFSVSYNADNALERIVLRPPGVVKVKALSP